MEKDYHLFEEDLFKGVVGENIFIDYIKEKKISFTDVRHEPYFQIHDVDFVINEKWYEVKNNYKDNECIILELMINANPKFGDLIDGWFYTSLANYFIFTSRKHIIQLRNSLKFYNWFEANKSNYTIVKNQPTINQRKQKVYQSGYVRIPIEDIPKIFIKRLK